MLYDLKLKQRSKLLTKENIINPIISGNYIFASGQPNKTYYDQEVCIYDLTKKQWVYKINNLYSDYKNTRDDSLINLQCYNDYLLWDTSGQNSITLFNKKYIELFTIVSAAEQKTISDLQLLDGGLIIWYERPSNSTTGKLKYIVLK